MKWQTKEMNPELLTSTSRFLLLTPTLVHWLEKKRKRQSHSTLEREKLWNKDMAWQNKITSKTKNNCSTATEEEMRRTWKNS